MFLSPEPLAAVTHLVRIPSYFPGGVAFMPSIPSNRTIWHPKHDRQYNGMPKRYASCAALLFNLNSAINLKAIYL
jgi:hypothetical protein